MVLFITGLCPKDCFYCPVSEERRIDATYANERKILTDKDVLYEARQMNALGTGITGGEPLLRKKKVLHYIRLLKNNFGPLHHIHMYTSFAPDKETLEELAEAGLDEIRFHPPVDQWNILEDTNYADSIKFAKETGMEAGIEIPSIDGADKVALFADRAACFLNLNELEFSDTNADAMKKLNFKLRDEISNSVAGSEEYAQRISSDCRKIHFCSSSYKDAVQLRKRLIRIAETTARAFDEISEDGTIYYGHIEVPDPDDMKILKYELSEMDIPCDMMEINPDGIDIAWWILEDLKEYVKNPSRKLHIIEKYPFKDGMIVEKIPL